MAVQRNEVAVNSTIYQTSFRSSGKNPPGSSFLRGLCHVPYTISRFRGSWDHLKLLDEERERVIDDIIQDIKKNSTLIFSG